MAKSKQDQPQADQPQEDQTPAEDLSLQISELTADLQRTRADFENYRKRMDGEKLSARQDGEVRAIMKLLPVITPAYKQYPEILRAKGLGHLI